MQKDDAEHRGHHRIQGTEHSCPLRRGAALRHRLQGEAEACADKGKHPDPEPFRAAVRQTRHFCQEAGRKAEKADHTHLDDAGGKRIDPAVSQPVRGQDRAGIEECCEKTEALT